VTDHDPPDEPLREKIEPGGFVVLAVLFEGSLAPLALALGWFLGQPPLASFSWSLRDALYGVLATVPMLCLLGIVARWPVGPLARIKRFLDDEVRPLLQSRPWHDLAIISVAAGVGEEMLFRGVIQGALGRLLGPAPGLVLASLVFGVLHPITPAYTLIAGFLGAYLGAVWLLTGNLLPVMIAHGLYDFVALLVLVRGRSDSSP